MQEHEKWLHIAKEDLGAAKALTKLEFFSSATYHCQQSAEKALKGYLVFKKQGLIKTHDLIQLIFFCKKFDQSFEKIAQNAGHLNPLATRFRYPTEFDIPDINDAEVAIKHAKDVMRFVLKKLAEPETGQENIFKVDIGDQNL